MGPIAFRGNRGTPGGLTGTHSDSSSTREIGEQQRLARKRGWARRNGSLALARRGYLQRHGSVCRLALFTLGVIAAEQVSLRLRAGRPPRTMGWCPVGRGRTTSPKGAPSKDGELFKHYANHCPLAFPLPTIDLYLTV